MKKGIFDNFNKDNNLFQTFNKHLSTKFEKLKEEAKEIYFYKKCLIINEKSKNIIDSLNITYIDLRDLLIDNKSKIIALPYILDKKYIMTIGYLNKDNIFEAHTLLLFKTKYYLEKCINDIVNDGFIKINFGDKNAKALHLSKMEVGTAYKIINNEEKENKFNADYNKKKRN